MYAQQLPSARTQGDPLSKFIQPPDQGKITQLLTGPVSQKSS